MEKLILVTGGATGIGKAVVRDQANRGNNIVYTYHKKAGRRIGWKSDRNT